MNLFKLISIVVLWSGLSQASPKFPETFQILSPEYKEAVGTKIEIENMPRVKSQDSMGVCYGCSAATIAQKFYCDQEKVKDCKSVPPDKDISILSMVSWARPDSPSTPESEKYTSLAHNNLKLDESGSGFLALAYSKDEFQFMTESCYPFDQLANKYGDYNDKLFQNNLEKAKSIYSKNKKSETEAAGECIECLNAMASEINSSFLTKLDAKSLSSLFKANTFEQFLYGAFFKSCDPELFFINPLRVDMYPKQNESGDRSKIIPYIKEALGKKKPLNIENVCMAYDANGTCNSEHAFTISGYKKSCNSAGKCRELFKVQNCWGEDWQKEFNDGWVDADSIVQNIQLKNKETGKPNYGILSWLVY